MVLHVFNFEGSVLQDCPGRMIIFATSNNLIRDLQLAGWLAGGLEVLIK